MCPVGRRTVSARGNTELQHTAQISLSSAQIKQKRAAICMYRRVVQVLHVNFMQFHSLSTVRSWISRGILGRKALGSPTGMLVVLCFISCYNNAPSRYVCITLTSAVSKSLTNMYFHTNMYTQIYAHKYADFKIWSLGFATNSIICGAEHNFLLIPIAISTRGCDTFFLCWSQNLSKFTN